ncbi:MAG TPA: NACHT domain-containing protein [Pyrinomonadaceae bacterium]
MSPNIQIRILETDNNKVGDLFGRLMADLFIALGYEQPRINIHKSGRELDLDTTHRLEPRRAIAECKATAQTIGGGDLNKFVGALDAEEKPDLPLSGYFISLSGFKETAIEQEKNRPKQKIIPLNGAEVVDELIKGRILIPRERATDLAGRFAAAKSHLELDPAVDLLAHDRGWIWSVYYGAGKERTHFALIHGDGTPLARSIADEIIEADRKCDGSLQDLNCLNPLPIAETNDREAIEAALRAYVHYLSEECGYIQLDGLPADSDVGSRKLQLENLFVPLHLDITDKLQRQPVGRVLSKNARLALLAAPGGGKSTLLKRLCVAYGDPLRRDRISDDLPDRDWLPLLFRCRELLELTRGSFSDLLDSVADKEPVRQHRSTFRAYVDRALLDGRVLLLIDGLDEITDSGDRAAFVSMLRTAVQAYPGSALIVTSREAGFRHVAAHLAATCTRATISAFNAEDIRRLTVSWHREVVGDSEKVRIDAEQLAHTIISNDRILRLAVNPLLLTTLLLVKRWVGSLPTRRAVLYGKAVEVLLMTWNTEGHEPIPESEALPQLCYVASAMMLGGIQKLSRPRLATLLQDARDALPTELGFVEGDVEDFIHRVEDRSSLLMMTGLDIENGRLVEFFEFRHLTFQEFLTARAMVEGWCPGRSESDTLVSLLKPHVKKEDWREVIPLAAALGGKAAEALIKFLTQLVKGLEDAEDHFAGCLALGNCLADEVAARPETIRSAIKELVRDSSFFRENLPAETLAKGRYGPILLTEAREAWAEASRGFFKLQAPLKCAVWGQAVSQTDNQMEEIVKRLIALAVSETPVSRCEGGLGFVRLLREIDHNSLQAEPLAGALPTIKKIALQLIYSDSLAENCAGDWLVYRLGHSRFWVPPSDPDVLGRLYELWRMPEMLHSGVATTITAQPLMDRDIGIGSSIDRQSFAKWLNDYGQFDEMDQSAALILDYYVGEPWSDAELTKLLVELLQSVKYGGSASIRELAKVLGIDSRLISPSRHSIVSH